MEKQSHEPAGESWHAVKSFQPRKHMYRGLRPWEDCENSAT
jgi:hypothetical protein